MYGMKQMLSEHVKSPLSFDCSCHMCGYLAPVLATVANRLDAYSPRSMFLAGSCFFVDKQKFLSIGLFDEDIFMYGEEDDIHWRFKHNYGARFCYNPQLRYVHCTLQRKLSLDTEKKIVESLILSHSKKGVERTTTIANRIRYYRVRYYSARLKLFLGKADREHVRVLSELLDYLKSYSAKC